MIEACTIISGNYLSHARVLAESFLEHNPGGRFVTLVIDDVTRTTASKSAGSHVMTLGDIGLDSDEIGRLAGIYDVTELATSVKPVLLRTLLDEGRDHIIYLDPDIKVHASLSGVADLARSHSIVLTPHTMVPVPRDDRYIATGNILASGAYNLGFIALGPRTDDFLAWWWQQTRRDALSDIGRMMFTDQRCIDLVPGFFEHFVLKDPGYNVAYWNLHARNLVWTGDRYTVDGSPLRFFHFSGFDHRRPYLLSKHQRDRPRILLSERPAVERICREYLSDLTRSGVFEEASRAYRWAHLPGGIPVSNRIRRLYREALLASEKNGTIEPPNPFDSQRPEDFVRWLNEPVQPEFRPTVSRLLYFVYMEREDLRAAFPQLAGHDAWRYLTWFMRDGIQQESLPSDLMPTLAAVRQANERAFAAPNELSPGVNLVGYFKTITGVGEQARLLAQSLEAGGVPFNTVTVGGTLSRESHHHLERGDPRASHDCNLLSVNADQTVEIATRLGPSFFEGRYNIGYWFWELDRLPESMYPAFEVVDEVWCASRFVTDAIGSANKRPVFTLPSPLVAPAIPKGRTRAMYGLPDRFMFLFIFDFLSIPDRKNPLGLVDAFERAFSQEDEPVLVIKSINGNQRLNYNERLRARVANMSNVLLLEDYMTADDKNGLLALCDSYVSLHRSEGTGLTLAEAMALGKPVIGTAYSGNLEFMTEHNSYLVDYVKAEVPAGCEPYPQGWRWADPVLDDAAEAMSKVFEDRGEAARRGARARKDILEKHDAKTCGARMVARLEEIRRSPRERGSLAAAHPTMSRAAPLASVPELLQHARALLTPRAEVSSEASLGSVRLAAQQAVLRLTRPYWWGQRQLAGVLIDAIQSLQETRGAAELSLADRVDAIQGLQQTLEAAGESLADRIDLMGSRQETLKAAEDDLAERIDAMRSLLDTGSARERSLATRIDVLESSVSRFQQSAAEHLAALTEVVARLEVREGELMHRLYPVPYMSDPGMFTYEDSSGRKALGFQAAGEARGRYIGFEDIFRGSEAFIRVRLGAYREFLEQADTVLDVGCGRGELLELVRELGKTGIGVDTDEEMVRRCLEKGLNMTRADGIEFLRSQQDSSIGLIFGSQIIEHMSDETVNAFFDLAFQKLKPRGILIAETVNPHSLEALKSFWVDLTHRHPIFPEVAAALCWLRGFESAVIVFPHGSGDLEADRRTQGEYAVVARKSGAFEGTN